MTRDVQRQGSEPVHSRPPTRDAPPLASPVRLATVIGNRAMQRLATGAIPTALSDGARTLQRDTSKDDKPTDAQADPKSGWWVRFKGTHTGLGDWLPLGEFSLGKGTGTDDVSGFVDIFVTSPKGLHLGTAFDNSEHVTLMIEQRSHDGKPIRQTPQEVVITSLELSMPKTKGSDRTGSGSQDPVDSRIRIRVGIRVIGTASESH